MIQLINLDDAALALLDDLPGFERRFDAVVGEHAALLGELGEQTRRLLQHDLWGGYLAVDATTRLIVGTCAFKARPTAEGVVEIAYFTFAAFEGRGYGTAMARGLIDIARGQPEVRRVIAHTLPEPGASPRILEKVGMTFEGLVYEPDDGLVWRWSLSAG